MDFLFSFGTCRVVGHLANSGAFLMLLGLSACRPAALGPSVAGGHDSASAGGTYVREGDIATYTSIPWGFSTNSYVIEGPTGLIAVDTQFLPSAAEELIQRAEAATKKNFVLAIVLHANPDKFNGTATFQKHGVRVITSAQVKSVMAEVHAKRLRAFYDRYRPDYPKELPTPEVFGDVSTQIEAGGVTLKLHVLGAGCSEAHVVVQHRHSVFVGDLVANRAHSWLEIGKTDAWLSRLSEIRAMSPTVVYAGRGGSGPARLLDDEEAYLRKVMAIVATEVETQGKANDDADSDEATLRAENAIKSAYPDYRYPVFLKIGLPAEFARQRKLRIPPLIQP